MGKTATRKYSSPLREEQALQTRLRILDATEKLLLESGYSKTTIEAVAAEAGVSAQTIYVIFKDKQGIMREVIARAFDDDMVAMMESSLMAEDPHQALRISVEVIVKWHKTAGTRFNLLRSAGILSPELAQIQDSCEREGQRHHAEHFKTILASAKLKRGLTMDKAIDIAWFAINYAGYHTLVVERGWKDEEYLDWLYEALTVLLLEE